jgi:penicillin-binding protein 2
MSRQNKRRGARTELRIALLGILILCGLGALVARLWWMQVARGEIYTSKITGRSQQTVRIPAVRGEIRDRNGVPLVQNRASYEVDFYLPDMVRDFRQRSKEMGVPVPRVSYQAPVKGMLKNRDEANIVEIVNKAVIPRLQDLNLAKDYNAKRLQKHFRTNTEVPFAYIEDVDFPTIAKFSEHDVGLAGVDISIKPVREYRYGAFAAHLLGYVGMPHDIDREEAAKYNFYQPDVEGRSQIELFMDKYLRGTPGVRVLQRNAKGMLEGDARVEPPKAGNNVYLTLDARIQMIVEQALRHPAIGRGAAVVVDPNNGDILGMASVPSFDPNLFVPSISNEDWDKLNKDITVPMVNRAVSGFPPGSTYKVVTALAGLKKNLANARYNCPGGVQYGNHFFHCWIAENHGVHGVLGLSDSLKVSCDSFFYQYGNAAGIENIDSIGQILGMGQRYDIGLGDEREGCLPGPEWMSSHYPKERWSNAHTANVSIGQGYVLASPLQMAMAYATIANGGVAYTPRLVHQVLSSEGQPVLDEAGKPVIPVEPTVRADLRTAVSQADIDIVRKGLWEVVNESGGPGGGGTGSKVRMKDVVVAGKTGSAQASELGKKDTIAWFCCFAPFDHPKYVITVMIQGGLHGGSVAGPVAARILEQTLAMDQGKYNPELVSLTPAHSEHPYQKLEALDYKANTAKVKDEKDKKSSGSSREESASSKPAAQKIQMEADKRSQPDIKPEADDAGRVPKTPAGKPQNRRNFFERFLHPRG